MSQVLHDILVRAKQGEHVSGVEIELDNCE